jgi:hypothetical protein
MREAGAKGKEIGGRNGGAQDFTRVFNRALELLSSTSPESDHELLELVKKSKHEPDKEPAPPVKKTRTYFLLVEYCLAQPILVHILLHSSVLWLAG